jgi:transcriptional regulator with XRE-family HTH domain
MENITDLIREELFKRNWSIYKLSKKVGVHYTNVWKWWHGQTIPTKKHICKILKVFEQNPIDTI